MKRLALLPAVVVAVIVALPGSAFAVSYDMQSTPVTPLDGGRYVPFPSNTTAMVFEFSTPVAAVSAASPLVVEVSTQNVAGQDGTLANDQLVAMGSLTKRDSDPTHFYGAARGPWTYPGTYYFQYSGSVAQWNFDTTQKCATVPIGSMGSCQYVSPVYSFTLAAPQPVPVAPTQPTATTRPTTTQPRTYLLGMVTATDRAKRYARYHFRARKPTAACRRVDASNVECSVRWRSRAGKMKSIRLDVIYDEAGYTVQEA